MIAFARQLWMGKRFTFLAISAHIRFGRWQFGGKYRRILWWLAASEECISLLGFRTGKPPSQLWTLIIRGQTLYIWQSKLSSQSNRNILKKLRRKVGLESNRMTGRGYFRARFTPDWLPETLDFVVIITFWWSSSSSSPTPSPWSSPLLPSWWLSSSPGAVLPSRPSWDEWLAGKTLDEEQRPRSSFRPYLAPCSFRQWIFRSVLCYFWANFVLFVPIYFAQFHLFFFRIFDALCFDTFSASLTLSLVQFPHVFKLYL